jgi:hypothetical protein
MISYKYKWDDEEYMVSHDKYDDDERDLIDKKLALICADERLQEIAELLAPLVLFDKDFDTGFNDTAEDKGYRYATNMVARHSLKVVTRLCDVLGQLEQIGYTAYFLNPDDVFVKFMPDGECDVKIPFIEHFGIGDLRETFNCVGYDLELKEKLESGEDIQDLARARLIFKILKKDGIAADNFTQATSYGELKERLGEVGGDEPVRADGVDICYVILPGGDLDNGARKLDMDGANNLRRIMYEARDIFYWRLSSPIHEAFIMGSPGERISTSRIYYQLHERRVDVQVESGRYYAPELSVIMAERMLERRLGESNAAQIICLITDADNEHEINQDFKQFFKYLERACKQVGAVLVRLNGGKPALDYLPGDDDERIKQAVIELWKR